MIKTIKVSEKGQIAIPQVIRDSLGINQGDDLIMIQMNNKILLEKSQKWSKNYKIILKIF